MKHGFENIDIQVIELSTSIENAASYTNTFVGMIMQINSKLWSEEERKTYGEFVKPALLKSTTEKYGEGKAVYLIMTSILSTARRPLE